MKKPGAKKIGANQSQSASELISERIAELGDCAGKPSAECASSSRPADPDVVRVEGMGLRFGRMTASSARANPTRRVVKLTFAKGASLKGSGRLFNRCLDGNVRRAIDLHEGERSRGVRFKALVAKRSPSMALQVETFEENLMETSFEKHRIQRKFAPACILCVECRSLRFGRGHHRCFAINDPASRLDSKFRLPPEQRLT